MQIYATNETDDWVEARHAKRQQDYRCIECAGVVRLRSGDQRQPHFYHLERSAECRQHGKGEIHLLLQMHLKKLLGEVDCRLEMRFDGIQRIADVVWLSKKLVFEIQCSPISPVEIRGRNAAYAREGYQVVWILHDQRYNQWKLSGAEQTLQQYPHYFTNMDRHGMGMIYDQWAMLIHGRRVKRSLRYPVDLTQPKPWKKAFYRNWPLHFAGDMIDLGALGQARIVEAYSLWTSVKSTYRALFQYCLEKACR